MERSIDVGKNKRIFERYHTVGASSPTKTVIDSLIKIRHPAREEWFTVRTSTL